MVRAVVLFVVLGSVGCASTSARSVFRDRDGGVVAVPDNTDAFPSYHRSEAMDLIREHVGKNFEIVKEEEYVLGPVVTNETHFSRRPILNWLLPWKLAESATTTNTSSTRNNTEYRIQYQRTPAPELPPLGDGVGR